MVSELSARLMRGHNFNQSTAPTTSAQTIKIFADLTTSAPNRVVSPNPSLSDHEPMMTISACSDKLDQISTTKKLARKANDSSSASTNEQGFFKRRKVDELQFAASRVKDDLNKGGLSYPALDTSLRHHVDLEEEATRGVSLVSSSKVATSPFLTNNNSRCSEMASMCDLGSLFSATFDCYNVSNNSNSTFVSNSDGGSICSLSSEKSSEPTIAPRLEDALNSQKIAALEETPEEKEQSAATALQQRAIYSNPIAIRDAFENSDEARIVTLSFAPFLVVHVNPAYTRMTGLSPADILGKPFHEVIEDPACKANTAKAASLTSLHQKVTSFCLSKADADDSNQFRINVSVVGPEPAERSSYRDNKKFATHYMISLEEHQEPEEEEEEEEAPQPALVVLPQAATVAPLMVLPSLAISSNVALMPAMRQHCGVMG